MHPNASTLQLFAATLSTNGAACAGRRLYNPYYGRSNSDEQESETDGRGAGNRRGGAVRDRRAEHGGRRQRCGESEVLWCQRLQGTGGVQDLDELLQGTKRVQGQG